MKYSSAILEKAIQQFSKLPGVGKKTALRFVLFLLKNPLHIEQTMGVLEELRGKVFFCEQCNNIADEAVCGICGDGSRNKQMLCIVENVRDVIAIEHTQQYNGLYFVLGNLISPLDGIGPDDLKTEKIVALIERHQTREIIFALSPNAKGDTTIFYIQKLIQGFKIKTTSISRGVAFGGELEYVDDFTLANAIQKRLPIENYVQN